MKHIIGKIEAIQIYYYFLALDGKIEEAELSLFKDIAMSTDPDSFSTCGFELVSSCKANLMQVKSAEDLSTLVKNKIKEILQNDYDEITEGVSRRLLIWNLYAIALSDGQISNDEKEVIYGLGDILDIEESVLFEMEQLMLTDFEIETELSSLSVSTKPYVEVRPIVDELENRRTVIFNKAKALIADDEFDISTPNKTKKKGVFSMKSGTDKAPFKLKKKDIILPKEYKKTKISYPDEMGIPKNAKSFKMEKPDANAIVLMFDVDEIASMPFDDCESIIKMQHENMRENEGLIEVNSGVTKAGRPIVYNLLKHQICFDGEAFPRVEYTCNINIKLEDTIKFLNTSYMEGAVCGTRDTTIYTMYMVDKADSPWTCDPYDEAYDKGFLMNQSEKEEYDELFPNHPLSEIRKFIKFICENN